MAGEWAEKAAQQRALAESLPDAAPAPVVEEAKPAAKGGKGGKKPTAPAKEEPVQPSPKQLALQKARELEENPTVDFDRQLVRRRGRW